MTEKNGGNTTGEVLWAALCDCSTEQAVPVRWLGGSNKIVRNEHRFFCIRDCSGNPPMINLEVATRANSFSFNLFPLKAG